MQVITAILFGLGLWQHAAALQVTPGSACAALCLNDPESDAQNPSSSHTEPAEIACRDGEYSTSPIAIKYKNCMECLQKSNATSQVESDTEWFLYNARYSVDVCIYGFRNETKRISTPCDLNTSCKGLRASLLAGDLDPGRSQLEYCSADDSAFTAAGAAGLKSCIQCYARTDETSYLANFLTALKAGCEQRPGNGALLGLSKSIFTSSLVEITDPPLQTTGLPGSSSSSFMTTGAIVGIAVGAGLLFLGGTGLFCVHHRRQKRLYADFPNVGPYGPRGGEDGGRTRASPTPPPLLAGGNRSLAPTPDLKKGGAVVTTTTRQHSLDDDLGGDYELRTATQHGFASNAQYYDRLEKEMALRGGGGHPSAAVTTTITSSASPYYPQRPPPTLTIPTHPAYIPRTHSRQSSSTTTKTKGTTMISPPLPSSSSLSSSASRPPRSNKPDSYALQAYLNAAEAAENHVPANPARSSNPFRAAMMTASAAASQTIPAMQQLSPPPPPPPPPPAGAKKSSVPSLAIPTIPRIRVPKKYPPPHIRVDGGSSATISMTSPSALASPTSQQGDLRIGIQIGDGGPLGAHPASTSSGSPPSYYDAGIRTRGAGAAGPQRASSPWRRV